MEPSKAKQITHAIAQVSSKWIDSTANSSNPALIQKKAAVYPKEALDAR